MENKLIRLKYAILAGVIIWVALIILGEIQLLRYDYTPHFQPRSLQKWPLESRIKLASEHPTLLMFVHPKCPCSRSSIGELSRLMTRCQGKLTAYVLFVRPSILSEQWVKTDLWKNAVRIPGVQVSEDIDGVEVERFHSATSGHALLYSKQGQLLFSGGITGSRGHFGDNDAREAVEMLVEGKITAQSPKIFPVFGCLLKAKSSIVDTTN